ncbi:hypothetical protein CsatA_015250 [Cannabis sativa]
MSVVSKMIWLLVCFQSEILSKRLQVLMPFRMLRIDFKTFHLHSMFKQKIKGLQISTSIIILYSISLEFNYFIYG